MKDLKFLIILPYFERPQMVKHALNSVKNQTYSDWKLAFIDDNSPTPGRPIVEEVLKEQTDKVTFYRIDYPTIEDKMASKLQLGHHLNIAAFEHKKTNDIMITLCDDDILFPDYLENLNKYYLDNPKRVFSSSYTKVIHPRKEQRYSFDKPTKIHERQTMYGGPEVSYKLVIFDKTRYIESRTAQLDDIYFQVELLFCQPGQRNDIWSQLVSHWDGSISNASISQLLETNQTGLTRSQLKKLHSKKSRVENLVRIRNEVPQDFEWENTIE